jgi:SHS family lactate transporter-like MFS transporter
MYVGIALMIFLAFLAVPLVYAMVSLPIMSAGVFIYEFANGFCPLISGIAASSVPPEVRAFMTGTAYNIGAGGIVSALIVGTVLRQYPRHWRN